MRTTPRAVAALILAGLLTVSATACTGHTTADGAADTALFESVSDRPMDRGISDRLDAILNSAVKASGIPGAVVGIWGPVGSYVRAAGVANTTTGAPMRADVYSRIGSATKTFTVTALLQLADQGKLGLDDPVGRYVPGVPNGKHITLRDLAGMRSGLEEYSNTPQFVSDYLANPTRHFSPQDLLAYTARHGEHKAAGTEVNYSNTNIILLGLVIEKVTGHSLASVINQSILQPLGLQHTSLPRDSEFPEPHARGYTNQTPTGKIADATDWNPSWGWAAGAMISNLEDLRLWVPALATGKLLSPGMQRQRLQTHPLNPRDPALRYGLGLFTINGWIGHNGSLPGYKTVTIYLPAQQTTLVVFINTDIDGPKDLVSALMTPITQTISPGNIYK